MEILEIFTTAPILKSIIWTWFFLLKKLQRAKKKKKKKKIFKKDARHLKVAWYRKRQRKNIEKREREKKNKKKSNSNNKCLFTFTSLFWKIYILLENPFGITLYLIIYIVTVFYTCQVIGNAVTKI